MTEVNTAKTILIVNEEPRSAVLNVLVEGEEVRRFSLNKAQLHILNSQSADILMKDYK